MKFKNKKKKEKIEFLFHTRREEDIIENSHRVIDATALLIVLRSIFFSPRIHFSFSLPLPPIPHR